MRGGDCEKTYATAHRTEWHGALITVADSMVDKTPIAPREGEKDEGLKILFGT